MDSQILPNAVEYLLTPLNRLSSPDQFIPAAAVVSAIETSAPLREKTKEKQGYVKHHKINYSVIVIV